MELLLNATWLLVAIAGALGLLRRVKASSDSTKLWVLATATLCVVVLLFPVISMSDDLHAPIFTAEDSGKRRVVEVQIQQQFSQGPALAGWTFAPPSTIPHISWAELDEPLISSPLEGTRLFRFTRPPPSPAFA